MRGGTAVGVAAAAGGRVSCEGVDPDSGALVFRLTSMPLWSHNIYCEQPYGSPDGKRVLIGRTHDLLACRYQLLVGWYDAGSNERLEPVGGSAPLQDRAVVLAEMVWP